MREKNPIETRAKLLRAAAEQITAHTILDLTLDQVAEAAAVSKGGLLHHFPTKLDLFKGLTKHLAERFMLRLNQELAGEPLHSTGRWARAYIRATFDTPPDEVKLMNALAAAIAAYPQLFDVYCAAFAALDAPHNDALPAARETLIRLACDGLALAEMSGSPPINDTLRAELFSQLMELSR